MSHITFTDRILAATLLKAFPRSITPNQVTVFRFITIPILFVLLWNERYIPATILFVISALSDAVDGALARTRNQQTDWGTLFDPLADKLLIITMGAVLMVHFLPLYVFLALAIIELFIILHSAYKKYYRGVVIRAHISGKIKMILQTLGTAVLLLHALGCAIPIQVALYIFYGAIVCGLVSLIVYKSA